MTNGTRSARDITRLEVQKWIDRWARKNKKSRGTLEDFIRSQVDAEVADPMVTKAHFNPDPESHHIADLIIDDLGSYRVPTSR